MKLSIPFLLFLCCLPSAHAQSVAGSGAVTGFILERLDSGLPDAEVTLSNSTLGLRRMTETTDDGAFDVPGLPPAGGYRLSVVCKGYAEWNSETFEIGVGQSKVFRILMQNDGSRSTDAESLKTPLADQSGFTTWVDPSRTSELPTSSRDLDPLILLAPTVSREAGGRITFQGIANANSVLNDGIAINSGYFGERLAIAGDLTQDSIQELRVLTANYPAEFGRAMGGIVDAVSPPGSNDFHGAAFG